MSNSNGFPIGSTFEDSILGITFTIIGEPVWSEGCKGYVQDVRDSDGWIVANAVEAMKYYNVKVPS